MLHKDETNSAAPGCAESNHEKSRIGQLIGRKVLFYIRPYNRKPLPRYGTVLRPARAPDTVLIQTKTGSFHNRPISEIEEVLE